MDSISSSALHVVENWKERLLEDDEQESRCQETVRIIRGRGRLILWNMATILGVNVLRGVPGQACTLLEKYLERCVQNAIVVGDTERWNAFKHRIFTRTPLTIVSCLQLAAKMSCANVQVMPSVVRSRLSTYGIAVSNDEIITMEYHVFSTLGFSVPLWTNVDIAQFLAMEVKLPPCFNKILAISVDMVERFRDCLNDHMQALAGLNLDTVALHKASVRSLHLCAGVVAAISKLCLSSEDQEPRVSQLSKLTRAPEAFIRCLSNVMLSHIFFSPNESTRTLKRKRSESDVNDDVVSKRC